MNQRHGDEFAIVDSISEIDPTCDALITSTPGLAVAVLVADCIPLLLTSPSVVALFDHEEVGSSSATGAAGPLLEHVLERLCIHEDLSRQDFINILGKSHCVSADNAHAVHHNYPERHDINHSPLINQGVVIKSNVGQRYATSATSIAPFIDACANANVPIQHFASRNNITCGSTIGPITATRLGIDTIDVGIPQLSMHSAREVCGSQDPIYLRDALVAYLAR